MQKNEIKNGRRNIESNVIDFLKKTSEEYGEMNKSNFIDDMRNHILEMGLKSPIEDIFYIAMANRCAQLDIPLDQDPYPHIINYFNTGPLPDPVYGLYTESQHSIGKYKVDFLITYQLHNRNKSIVVELDGHEFHDKDKKQRSYEKARDRFILSKGYKIFHFTGSDVVRSPYSVIDEVLTSIGALSVEH